MANTYSPDSPGFTIAVKPIVQRHGARDPSFRPTLVELLLAYNTAIAWVRRLRNLVDCRLARQKLDALGVSLTTDEHEFAYESASSEADKAAADAKLARQILAKLEAAITPHAARISLAAAAELETDLAALSVVDPLIEKYGAPAIPLKSALRSAISRLHADASKPLDLKWHYDPRIACSQIFFPDNEPIFLDPPTPPPSPAAPDTSAASSLRSAREITSAATNNS